MLITNLLIFLASCAVLVAVGTLLVRSLTRIASFLRISEFVVGFIIMAVATTLPELFVSITSALAKNTALALGTVIGSNIVNLSLIGGVVILLARGIKLKKGTKTDTFFMTTIAILPLVLFWIGRSIDKVDGIILLVVFCLYSWRLIRKRKPAKEVKNTIGRWNVILATIIFVASLVVLFLSANFVVRYATLLSIDLALPSIMIGLFLVALGTSLPELAFGSRAALMGHSQMALGDLIGAVIVNSTLVLGVTALIWPITGQFTLFFVSAIFMALICFLFATFVESGKKLGIMEGISLLLLYIFFILVEFYIKGRIVI